MIRNSLTLLLFLSIFLYSCQDKEEPNLIYGEYTVDSMISADPMDINGDGEVTNDFWKQIQSSGRSPEMFRLNLFSPEYFSVYFAQVIFNLPRQLDTDSGIRIEEIYVGRKFERQEDGSISLGYNTHIHPGSPYQLGENIMVNQMVFEPRNQIIHLDLTQSWYDHTLSEWRETTINYKLKKRF